MPCNGGNYFGSHTRVVSDPRDKKTIDVLTRRLCYACRLLKKEEVRLPPELDEWFFEHDLQDQQRIAEAKRRKEQEEEQLRRDKYLTSVKDRLLEQLTDDEKEALGL